MVQLHKLKLAALILFFIIFLSLLMYHFIAGLSWFDSFYMIIITITTVGFKEVGNLGFMGRVITIFLIFSGIGLLAYIFTQGTSLLIEGQLNQYFKDRKMKKKLSKLYNHYIICTDEGIGKYIISEFLSNKKPFVVITKERDFFNELLLTYDDVTVLLGNPMIEETLEIANIEKAEGIITATSRDEDNLFIIMTAKELNEKIKVISISHDDTSEKKLQKVGADFVVSANRIGGLRLAAYALKPNVISFLEIMSKTNDEVLTLNEIIIPEDSFLVERFLRELRSKWLIDVIILGIKFADTQRVVINPNPMTIIRANDCLIVYGREKEIENFRNFVKLAKEPKGGHDF